VTVWEALDQLCDKAGLVEIAPPASPPDPSANPRVSSSVVIMGGRMVTTPTDVLRTAPEEKPPELLLGDGKSARPPTSYAGALRIALASPDAPLAQQRKDAGEALLGLEVHAEGRLHWQKAVGVRVERALDEDGRPLAQLPTSFRPPTAASGRSSVIINGMPIDPPPEEPTGLAARLVAIRLRHGDEKPPKKLKELTGTIVAQVQTPAEALVTVERVLKSGGLVVKGERAGAVKVIDVVKEEDGHIRLKVQVEAAPRALGDSAPNPFNATVIVNGRRLGIDENLLSSFNFALLDEQGRAFRTIRAVSTGVRAGAAQEYELLYQPQAAQGEASRFVYTDRRTLFIDVPFTLKDVPLPE
jgi:hypothetical protein